MARPPASVIAPTVSAPVVSLMSATVTQAPAAASIWAMARPMPLPAPVTTALRPSRRNAANGSTATTSARGCVGTERQVSHEVVAAQLPKVEPFGPRQGVVGQVPLLDQHLVHASLGAGEGAGGTPQQTFDEIVGLLVELVHWQRIV